MSLSSTCSLEDQQVYDRCKPLLLRLLNFSTVLTTQEYTSASLGITRSDLTTLLSKNSPLLIETLHYVRNVLMYHKTHFTMSFLLARMLSLFNTLKDAPSQNAIALDLAIDNFYLLLAAVESRDQLVNACSFADRCDAVTAEAPSIYGVEVGPCKMVADFTSFVKETEYSSDAPVQGLAVKAVNYIASYIIAPYFSLEASKRARVKVGSCRYIISRTHEAENHLYLMSFLSTQMAGSRLITHLVYTLMSYTPVVGFYTETFLSFSRSVSYGRLGIAGQEYRPPIIGGKYMDSNVAGYPSGAEPPLIPATVDTEQTVPSAGTKPQAYPESVADTLNLPQFYLQNSNKSSRTKNCTSTHIPPITVTNLAFYPFLSCFTEGFNFCTSCQERLLKTAYKDETEVHNRVSRERIFTCDRCYASFVFGQITTALFESLEKNVAENREIVSYSDIIGIFGYIFICHQAVLIYIKSSAMLGTSDQQQNSNIQWKLIQTRRLVNSLNEAISIGGFYKSEGSGYNDLYKLKAVFENEYMSTSVPLSTDFPFPSPFAMLANDECSCRKAKSLRPQRITINSTQETVTDVGHLLLKKPIMSNHVFHAKDFFADINVYKENPLWVKFDPFELTIVDLLSGLTKGKLFLHLLRQIERTCQFLKEKVLVRDLPYHKVELVYARSIYNYAMFLGTFLDFYLNYDYSEILAATASVEPGANKGGSARLDISISKESIETIGSLLATVRSIAQLLEEDLFCYDLPDDICVLELQDDYKLLESLATARHCISTRRLLGCDGVISVNEYEVLMSNIAKHITENTSQSPNDILYKLILEAAYSTSSPVKPKKFPILSTIQDAAERDFVAHSPSSTSGSQQVATGTVAGGLGAGTGTGGGSLHNSVNQTLIATSGFNALVKAELNDQTVGASRLLNSSALVGQPGYSNADINKYLSRRMHHDHLRNWQDVVLRFRANVVQCISAGQSYEPASNTNVDCMILKKSITASPNLATISTIKQGGQLRASLQLSSFRSKLLNFLLSTVDSAIPCGTIGLPYMLIRRKFAPQIMRQVPYNQYPERLYLHSALSTLYIGAISPIHAYRGAGTPQIKADSPKFIHPSLAMYYSIHYIQESKYTLRFYGSNLFRNEPFEMMRIRAAANLMNSTIALEAKLYRKYILEIASAQHMQSSKYSTHSLDRSLSRSKVGGSTTDLRPQPQENEDLVLNYTQHNTEIPSICTSSYHAQALYVVESDTHSLGICLHNQESMMAISPAVLQNDRLHVAADASYADCFSVSKVSGKMGMISPSSSLYTHPSVSAYRFMTELTLCGMEVELFSSIMRKTSAATNHCFELTDSFLISQNCELSKFLLTFALMHKIYTRDCLSTDLMTRCDGSFSGPAVTLLFQGYLDDLDQFCLGIGQQTEVPALQSDQRHLAPAHGSISPSKKQVLLNDCLEEHDDESKKPASATKKVSKAGLFSPHIFTTKGRDCHYAGIYYEKLGSQGVKGMACGLDACSMLFVPIRVLNQVLTIGEYDEECDIAETINAAEFCIRLQTVESLARTLSARPVVLYNTTLLRFLASILRSLSLSINAITLSDFAAQLVLCNFVSLFISHYGLTNLAVTLADTTHGFYSSIMDQPSNVYRKMRLASSVDAYLKTHGGSLGRVDDFIHFVDLTQGSTRIPVFSTLFDSDPTLTFDVTTGHVIVLNVETKTILLMPLANYITAKWFYMQLHSVIIRYVQLLLMIDLKDLTKTCASGMSSTSGIVRYIANYASMIITLKSYLASNHLQTLAIDITSKETAEEAKKTLILSPFTVLQHSYFLSVLKDLHRQLYVRINIAVQQTQLQSQVVAHWKSLKDFLLMCFFSRLTILTKQYISNEKCYQLQTETTNYRNPTVKKPSIYTLATISLDIQPLLKKGKLQTVIENYHKASKGLSQEDNARFEELRNSVDTSFRRVFSTDSDGRDGTFLPTPLQNQDMTASSGGGGMKGNDEHAAASMQVAPASLLSQPFAEYLLMLDTLLVSLHTSTPDIGVDCAFLASLGLPNAAGVVALWTDKQ